MEFCYNVCFYSNFIFLINVIVAIYYKYYTYAAVFMFLMVTSLYHHSHYTEVTRIVDKIAIYLVVFYGGYLFYSKLRNHTEPMSTKEWVLTFLIGSTFLSTILLYYYGYVTSSLCYCEDSSTANYFHAFMHCVGSAGHLCVAVL
jgi:hypothetical protein